MEGQGSARGELVAALVGRDRALVWAGIAGLTLSAWGYLIHLHRAMAEGPTEGGLAAMPGMTPVLLPWTATDVLFTVLMWAVMMVGMMLPAATPVILLVAAINRRRRAQGGVVVPTAVFVLGYLLVWGGFSIGAALLQWGLQRAALLSPALAATSPILGGALLVGAGVYQLSPLKDTCLAHCRSPLGFLMTAWRDGWGGALRMGLGHGAYCLGCCALLMGLLFVAGVMNLVWVAAITAFVLLEKVAPAGVLIGRVASATLILLGLLILTRATGLLGT